MRRTPPNQPSLFHMRWAWNREQERQKRQAPTCSGCGARIIWIKMGTRKDGKPGGTMPCDPDWLYGDSKRHLVILDDEGKGHLIVKAATGLLGRESHFGTCPKRKEFNRK